MHAEIRKDVFRRLGIPEYDTGKRKSITSGFWGGVADGTVLQIALSLRDKSQQSPDPLGEIEASTIHNRMVKEAEMAKNRAKIKIASDAGDPVSSGSREKSSSYLSVESFMNICVETEAMQNNPGKLQVRSTEAVHAIAVEKFGSYLLGITFANYHFSTLHS